VRPATAQPTSAETNSWDAPAQLRELVDSFYADHVVRTYVGQPEATDHTGTTWKAVHLALLRLPPKDATVWRDRLKSLARHPAAGARLIPSLTQTRTLVPAWSGGGQWQIDLDTTAPLDPEVAEALNHPDHGDGERWAVGVLASQALALSRVDQTLYDLASYAARGALVQLSDDSSWRTYERTMVTRLHGYARESDDPGRLRELILVDEALRSLVHMPPVAPDSWWEGLREQSHKQIQQLATTIRNQGGDAVVTNISGEYQQALAHRLCDPGEDRLIKDPDRAGTIISCLRLFSQIDGERSPGRVLVYDR
jgi:hypothetical protein